MFFLFVLLGAIVAWTIWTVISLILSYREARQIGLPILITPMNKNFVWVVLQVPLRSLLEKYLPESIFFRFELSTYGFEGRVGHKIRERLGPSWVLVGPGMIEFWTTDSEISKTITTRHADFTRLEISKKVMSMFGDNLLTAEGEHWQRQRRIVAPTLNENVSRHVWNESKRQAEQIVDTTLGLATESDTDDIVELLRRAAINVLSCVSYGKPRDLTAEEVEIPDGHKIGYIDSLTAIANNLIPAALFSPALLCLPILPEAVQRIGHAVYEYPQYTKEIVAEERKSSQVDSRNLMSAIVKSSDQSKSDVATKSKLSLTEDEITGTLFQFTLAGFDTTANTMAYAIANVSVRPDLQEWIQEELDRIYSTGIEYEYKDTFPKMKRCLALMYETMRLYTSVPHLDRRCEFPQTVVSSSGIEHHVPANCDVFVSMAQAHLSPEQYGPDPLAFRPGRWFAEDGETLVDPATKNFMAWSRGPRICPGMKMAQVEFVTIFATILRHCKVEPTLLPNESAEAARLRIIEVMRDSQPLITLQMNRPKDLKLKWTRR